MLMGVRVHTCVRAPHVRAWHSVGGVGSALCRVIIDRGNQLVHVIEHDKRILKGEVVAECEQNAAGCKPCTKLQDWAPATGLTPAASAAGLRSPAALR